MGSKISKEEMFRELGYPECWSDFARHRDDAGVQLRRPMV
jgi:hypothetical protein